MSKCRCILPTNVACRPRCREVAVPLPEVAVTVFSTPDDGCCDTRNIYSDSAVNKYLHTVASGWIFINIELRCTGPWALKNSYIVIRFWHFLRRNKQSHKNPQWNHLVFDRTPKQRPHKCRQEQSTRRLRLRILKSAEVGQSRRK